MKKKVNQLGMISVAALLGIIVWLITALNQEKLNVRELSRQMRDLARLTHTKP